MKTFKLVSLQIVEDQGLIDISLEDGLIINKEDHQSSWLIEAYIKKDYLDLFQKAHTADAELNVQVVITKKDNRPAPFLVKVRLITEFKHHISVLLEGSLNNRAE